MEFPYNTVSRTMYEGAMASCLTSRLTMSSCRTSRPVVLPGARGVGAGHCQVLAGDGGVVRQLLWLVALRGRGRELSVEIQGMLVTK